LWEALKKEDTIQKQPFELYRRKVQSRHKVLFQPFYLQVLNPLDAVIKRRVQELLRIIFFIYQETQALWLLSILDIRMPDISGDIQ
jgi:hypothetical protein